MRPESIRWFERVYIGRVIFGLGLWLYSFRWTLSRAIGPEPEAIRAVWGLKLLAIALFNIALLYFIARRANTIAKWIFVVSAVLMVIPVINSVIAPNFLPAALKMGPLFGVGLDFTMIMLLFQPDSREWFERRGVMEEDYADTFS